MRYARTSKIISLLGLGALVAGLAVPAAASDAGGAGSGGAASNASTPVCLPAQAGIASCDAIRLNDPSSWSGQHVTAPNKRPVGGGGSAAPAGYNPCDLWAAYQLGGSCSLNGAGVPQMNAAPLGPPAGTTVAIVDAYSDPNVFNDLNTYRNEFGLHPICLAGSTTCSGPTLTVKDWGGGANTSWSQEISLDVDMVSAICPTCNILLEEAASNQSSALGAAVNDAAGQGVHSISNSYGSSEYSGETSSDAYYTHPGIAITASAGDNGYGVEYPAASPSVTAVGGTTLNRSNTGGFTETVWSGTGSGCSQYETAPKWQPLTNLCGKRTVADVAAVADPNTGVAVYDTYGQTGWLVFGGTSVASPIIASVYAIGGGTTPQGLYAQTSGLNRITSGMNSGNWRHPCTTYLCNAADSIGSASSPTVAITSGSAVWYNGPTGTGTPQGTSDFK
ncbi:MAG TPA: hypothetical protein VFP54_12250 [Acidimicrobiales bacterium]|nr:hypothetical protein [Acidimicrobiales bacterium]